MPKPTVIMLLFCTFLLLVPVHSQEIKTLGILNLESTSPAEVKPSDVKTLTNRLHT